VIIESVNNGTYYYYSRYFDIKAYRQLNMANIVQETANIVDPDVSMM
jgi:hypothetical protein